MSDEVSPKGLRDLQGLFVGIVPPTSFEFPWYMKRLMLLFDSLALDFGQIRSDFELDIIKRCGDDIAWMRGNGLLTALNGLGRPPGVGQDPLSGSRSSGELFLATGIGRRNARALLGEMNKTAWLSMTDLRQTASVLREHYGVDAVAIPTKVEPQNVDAVADRHAVVRIVLNDFPAPSESTPWESILDFKGEEKSRAQLARLRKWIGKITSASMKEYEVVDELRSLMSEYQQTIERHEMKAAMGTLEIVVTTTAEVAESLLRLKPAAAAKALFGIKKVKLSLLEEEEKAPGREIAYAVSAWKEFGAR